MRKERKLIRRKMESVLTIHFGKEHYVELSKTIDHVDKYVTTWNSFLDWFNAVPTEYNKIYKYEQARVTLFFIRDKITMIDIVIDKNEVSE